MAAVVQTKYHQLSIITASSLIVDLNLNKTQIVEQREKQQEGVHRKKYINTIPIAARRYFPIILSTCLFLTRVLSV